MKTCVINCSNPISELLHNESDVYVDYRAGRSSCFEGARCIKQCRSWHSWPYALETEFFVYLKDRWQDVYKYDAIIVLVNREIDKVMPLVKKLKAMNKKVAISFHEGGSDLLGGSGLGGEDVTKRWIGLYDLVQTADFYINLFGQLAPFFEGWFGKDKVKYCNHGAPLDWSHGFTKKKEDRKYDILIGTRTLNQRLARNSMISLGVLNGLSQKRGWNVHYLSEDGDVSSLLKRIGITNVQVHQGPMEWTKWIEFLSNFKCVVMADNSLNLGQIVYDCRMVNVGFVGSTTWNSMLLGENDGSDYRNWEDQIDNSVYETESLHGYHFDCKHHPDSIKGSLTNLFEDIK